MKLTQFLAAQPLINVILSLADKPRHIRNLANGISLSGVSDIVSRLEKEGIVEEERKGNRRYIIIKLDDDEKDWIASFSRTLENSKNQARAKKFSKNAAKKLRWMDEAYTFFRSVKSK